MTTLLLTGWHGTTFAKMAAHTVPIVEAYAWRHGMQFCCVNLAGERPASWMKIPALYRALHEYDRVVWIDADVVIVDPSENIADFVPNEMWQGLVEHCTPSGAVPNCGVWVLTKHMLPTLVDAWNSATFVDHAWWEQAAILERIGYAVTDGPHACLETPTELYQRTAFIGNEWNDHPHDSQRHTSPRFVHVTQYADRVGKVRELAAGVQL